MSLHNPFPSILDRPTPQVGERHLHLEEAHPDSNDYTLAAITESAMAATVHHDIQTAVVMRGIQAPVLEFDPVHVHSTTTHGGHMVATSQEHLDSILNSGNWSKTPLEVTSLHKEK